MFPTPHPSSLRALSLDMCMTGHQESLWRELRYGQPGVQGIRRLPGGGLPRHVYCRRAASNVPTRRWSVLEGKAGSRRTPTSRCVTVMWTTVAYVMPAQCAGLTPFCVRVSNFCQVPIVFRRELSVGGKSSHSIEHTSSHYVTNFNTFVLLGDDGKCTVYT